MNAREREEGEERERERTRTRGFRQRNKKGSWPVVTAELPVKVLLGSLKICPPWMTHKIIPCVTGRSYLNFKAN